MKKIIFEKKEDTIHVDDVKDNFLIISEYHNFKGELTGFVYKENDKYVFQNALGINYKNVCDSLHDIIDLVDYSDFYAIVNNTKKKIVTTQENTILWDDVDENEMITIFYKKSGNIKHTSLKSYTQLNEHLFDYYIDIKLSDLK